MTTQFLRLAFILLCASSAFAACTNTAGADATYLQSAATAGGLITLTGQTCNVPSVVIHLTHNPTDIEGGGTALLNGNQGAIFSIENDNITINGVTLNSASTTAPGFFVATNFVFTNNTVRNLYSFSGGSWPGALEISALINATITGNHFSNIWGGGGSGWPNVPPTDSQPNADTWGQPAMVFHGIDNTNISNNTFDKIAMDGMHIDWMMFTGNTGSRTTHNNLIKFNTFTNERRMPIELQTQPGNSCPGGCSGTYHPNDGLVVGGNYAHDYSFPYYDTWGSSLVPDGALGNQYINNTWIANPGNINGYAACFEADGRNLIVQGNICASVAGGSKSFGSFAANGGGSNSSFTTTYQNNIGCGFPNAGATGGNFVADGVSLDGQGAGQTSTLIFNANYNTTGACPGGVTPTTSAITPIVFTSFSPQTFISGGNGTWTVTVVSNLSIKYVQFFVDGSTSPITTQELQDYNSNFATDRKWHYHATFNTSTLPSGTHFIQAMATDVSGATASPSAAQTFTVGASTCSFTPTTLASGTVGIAYSQTLAPSNCPAGTFTLAIGPLPPGLTLNPSGLINGTPTAAGVFPITVAYAGTTQTFSISIVPAASGSITCSPLNQAAVVHQGATQHSAIVNGIEGIVGGIVPDWSGARILWKASAASDTQQILYATAAQWAANPNTYTTYNMQSHQTAIEPSIGANAGRGYGAGDVVNVVQASASGGQIYVNAVDSSGAVTALSRINPGTGYTAAANLATTTTGNGVGLTVTLSFSDIMGNNLTGLSDATLYHVAGQSSSDGGAHFCAPVDETFTTAAYPGVVHPDPAAPVTNVDTYPALGGHDYLVGTDAACKSGVPATDFQACINAAHPSDSITLPAGTTFPSGTNFFIPVNPDALAIPQANLNSATGTFTCTACVAAWSNGQQVRIEGIVDPGSGPYPPPFGLSQGVTYSVLNRNSGAGTFQLSYDGSTAIPSYESGILGTLYMMAWPPPHTAYTVIRSNGAMPPFGVRFDPAAYGAQTAVVEKTATAGVQPDKTPVLMFGSLASYWWIGPGLQFAEQPTALSTETDPYFYGTPLTWTQSNDHIVFDRNWINPAPPPDRTLTAFIWPQGTNTALLGNYVGRLGGGGEWWNLARFIGPSTFAGTTITINGTSGVNGTYQYPPSRSCAVTSAKPLTITGGTGDVYIQLDPQSACALRADMTTGMTATGAGYTITTRATPGWLTDTHGRMTTLPLVSGHYAGGVLASNGDFSGLLEGVYGSNSIEYTGNPGPVRFDNNFVYFTAIGIFYDVFTSAANCGPDCAPQFVGGDVTETRNTVTYDPVFYVPGPLFNGGAAPAYTGVLESKEVSRALISGNRLGPSPVDVAPSTCLNINELGIFWPPQFVNYQDASNFEYSYNSCLGAVDYGISAGGGYGGGTETSSGMLVKKWWFHDSVFAFNAYTSFYLPATPIRTLAYGAGILLSDGLSAQDYLFEHNTDYRRGGVTPQILNHTTYELSGATFRNNIFSYPADNGYQGINDVAVPGNGPPQKCGGAVNAGLIGCLGHAIWDHNVIVPTWSNSTPGATVDLTAGQSSTYQTTWNATSPTALWPGLALTTAEARIAATGFVNPLPIPAWQQPFTADLRLKFTSPYTSGGTNNASDFLAMGANIEKLNAVQGKVTVSGTSQSGAALTLSFLAPNTFACPVDFSVGGPPASNAYTRQPDTTSVLAVTASPDLIVHKVTMTVPRPATVWIRIDCQVEQPIVTAAVN